MNDDNVLSRGYTYQIGGRYITTYNEALASPLYDIRCLEARGSASSFLDTIIQVIIGLHRVATKYGLTENELYVSLMGSIFEAKNIVADEDNGTPDVNKALKLVFDRADDLQKFTDIIEELDRKSQNSEAEEEEATSSVENVREAALVAVQNVCGFDEGEESDCTEENINEKREEARQLIYEAVFEHDQFDLLLYCALLNCCDNWSTYEILDIEYFRKAVDTAAENHLLRPEQTVNWMALSLAATNNDPQEFMTDMDKYYDLLATAMEKGEEDVSDIARDIMNTIWEPENIIEED